MGPLFHFCEGRPRTISSFLTGTWASPTPVGVDAFSRLNGTKCLKLSVETGLLLSKKLPFLAQRWARLEVVHCPWPFIKGTW